MNKILSFSIIAGCVLLVAYLVRKLTPKKYWKDTYFR